MPTTPRMSAPPDRRTSSPVYRTFMVRCWLEAGEEPAWRFAVLEVGSRSPRRGFATFDDLAAFLQQQMAAMEEARQAGSGSLRDLPE